MGLAACCAEGLGEGRGFGEEGGLAGDLTALILDGSNSGVMPAKNEMFTCLQRQVQFSACQQQLITADTLNVFNLTR